MQTFSTHSVLSSLSYRPVRKKQLPYVFFDLNKRDMNAMPALSYGVNPENNVKIMTVLPDGKETENIAMKGDIIMSGVSREKYVVKAAKFSKLYTGSIGSTVNPEQTPRMVARYTDSKSITFKAPWGEDMIVKQGDYIVSEADGNGYYRIAKAEFERTYERIP